MIETLLGILFVGGVSLLAQWSRKNQAAEISLLVILFSIPCLAIALIVLLGGLGVIPASNAPVLSAVSAIIIVLASLAGISLCIPPLRGILRHSQTAARYAESTGYEDSGLAKSHISEGRFSAGWWSDPAIRLATIGGIVA